MQPKLDKDKVRMIEDFSEHLSNKLNVIVEDTIDTCERFDIETKYVAMMLISNFTSKAVAAAQAAKMDEATFIGVCKACYRYQR